MICVCVGEKRVSRVLELIAGLGFAEVRLDKIGDITEEGVTDIFSSHPDLIATFRPAEKGERFRRDMLLLAIKSGAAYVDIECESERSFIDEIIELSAKTACKVIISYHNFEETPGDEKLDSIVRLSQSFGADIVKVACMINSTEDNLRLLKLLGRSETVIPIGMGELGRIIRVAPLFLGAPFVYASMPGEAVTAPGQIDFKSLGEIVKRVENG